MLRILLPPFPGLGKKYLILKALLKSGAERLGRHLKALRIRCFWLRFLG
jgi:hypothetical protein